MKINHQASYDMVRKRYGSIPKAAKAFGVDARMIYWTISGKRGGKTHPAPVADKVMSRLRAEDLLVYEQEAVNG